MPISAKYGAAIGVRIAAIYIDITMVECGQLLQRRLRILFVDRVNLLPFALGNGNGFHCRDGFRARIYMSGSGFARFHPYGCTSFYPPRTPPAPHAPLRWRIALSFGCRLTSASDFLIGLNLLLLFILQEESDAVSAALTNWALAVVALFCNE